MNQSLESNTRDIASKDETDTLNPPSPTAEDTDYKG